MQVSIDHNTKVGILGGTLFSAFLNLSWDDVVFTIIMAIIGAIVSFIVSLSLRWIVKKLNN